MMTSSINTQGRCSDFCENWTSYAREKLFHYSIISESLAKVAQALRARVVFPELSSNEKFWHLV